MSSAPIETFDSSPAWNGFRVATFGGQHDTHIETGEDYSTLTLAAIFTMEPQSKTKMAGNAFLASCYCGYDARSHETQREQGSFVALVGDVDKGDLSIDVIRAATERFADGTAWLIYSSAHARDGDRRWRMVFPLDRASGFDDWYDAQTALFTYMESAGIPMDRALSRAGQPIYLPNVPFAYKDGTPLRDSDGSPIYYETASSGLEAPGLDIARGIAAGGVASIRQQRALDDRERDTLRAAAAARHAARPKGDGANIIEQFNSATSIATMLTLCGYEQSPRSADDWRSPLQTGGTFATRIIEEKWVSLSASDAASGLGSKCRSGCFGDAYDLYVHFKHNGDHKEAYRTLGREQRGHNVVRGNFRGEEQDPGWEQIPDWVQDDGADSVVAEFFAPPAASAGDGEDDGPLPGVADPAGWKGRTAPERRFIIPGWLVRGHAGLLSGMEGVGKSLIAQQMLTCAAVGKSFLGLPIEHVKAVYITCEDTRDELWRRQEAINKALGITMDDIAGRLLLVSLCGELGNELGTFAGDGILTPSKRYRQIRKLINDFGAELAVLDNAAHLFAGNENARHDVAAFLGLLERLSQAMDGAILLLAHPNKQHAQGNKQGNEYSGSTGWSAHVRNRLFLDYRTPGEDGLPVDDDERVLRKSKANYGKRGEEIDFRWHEWAFVRIEDLEQGQGREIALINQANGENARFMECLDKATSERRTVSARPAASNYAPKAFAKMTIARGMPIASFAAAMERLLHLGEILADTPVFKRDNRTVAMGIGRNPECTNHCTNPAQSGAQSMHKAAHQYSHSGAVHSTPSTTYIGEPLDGPPTMYERDDFESWESNPLLNPNAPIEPPDWMDEAPPWDVEA